MGSLTTIYACRTGIRTDSNHSTLRFLKVYTQSVFFGVGTKPLSVIEIKCEKLVIGSPESHISFGTNLNVRYLRQTNAFMFQCYKKTS
jgi:hypothetical protein